MRGARTDLEAVRQPQVGDEEGNEGQTHEQHGDGRAERPTAPEEECDDSLDGHHDPAVGVHRGQEPGRAGRPECRLLRAQDERPHEEVGSECGGEGEERVHATEAAVDREHPRAGCDDRRSCARDVAVHPAAEVVADGHRRQGEDDGEPAQRLRRGIERERDVDEQEVERRPTPVPQGRDDDLPRRPGPDQARDGLVLEERLAVNIGRQAGEEKRARPDGADERPAGASPRPKRLRGRPGPGGRVRGRLRATRRRR
jgi:hypothetical protein